MAKVRTYTLYVVKLHEDARVRVTASLDRYDRSRVNPKLPCLYVGYTSGTPKRRLEKHLSGDRVGSSMVREHGMGLLKSFTRGRRRLQSEDQALAAEAALAEELRHRVTPSTDAMGSASTSPGAATELESPVRASRRSPGPRASGRGRRSRRM